MEVQAYRTHDGKLFEDYEDFERYEFDYWGDRVKFYDDNRERTKNITSIGDGIIFAYFKDEQTLNEYKEIYRDCYSDDSEEITDEFGVGCNYFTDAAFEGRFLTSRELEEILSFCKKVEAGEV